MNISQELYNALLKQESYLDENSQLNKWLVIRDVHQKSEKLLLVLLKNKTLKKFFFIEVEGHFIFDEQKLISILEQNSFFAKSVTRFKNKIGLNINNQYLAKQDNVELVWPYKDTVLEGSQTKEEQKQNEVFYNETIHSNEINQLFEPKVLVNWKKYSSNGEHSVSEISTKDNLILRGNNLLALHSLRSQFESKIKLIYIDPPYNTGSDSFQYNDRFSHSTWLTFMKNRLEIAYKLLRSDGAIFIHVDDSEFAYLKVLCDELFGRENHKETIVLKSSTESGVNAINVKRGERLFKVKEYILFYTKSKKFRFKPFYTKTIYNRNYKYEFRSNGELVDIKKEFQEEYTNRDLSSIEQKQLSNHAFETYCLSKPENIYSLEKNIKKAGAKFKAFAAANKNKNSVEEFITSDGRKKLVYKGGELVSLNERIIKENGQNYFGVLASDLWVDIATTASTEGGTKFANGKKPEKLLRRIIEMTTEKGDIVLDYHLGSGTTAAVAHKLNRQYIGIEQLNYGENDSMIRLQNVVGNKDSYDKSGISKEVEWKGGGSFVYAELMQLNEFFVDEIQLAKNSAAIWGVFQSMKTKARLDYRLNFNQFDENIEQFQLLTLIEQKDILLSILDKNQLYVPISSLDDEDFSISELNKQLNNQFYNGQL